MQTYKKKMAAFEEFSKLVHSAKVVARHDATSQVTLWERNERCMFFAPSPLCNKAMCIAFKTHDHVWATVADYGSATMLVVRPVAEKGEYLIEYRALFDALLAVVSRGRTERSMEAFLHLA